MDHSTIDIVDNVWIVFDKHHNIARVFIGEAARLAWEYQADNVPEGYVESVVIWGPARKPG